jgi:Fur family transcriptional regulator, ferric uptake regulator
VNSPTAEGPVRRQTRQRTAVLDLLDRLEGFRSSVGLATVYRALQALQDDGLVDVLRSADGEASYRRCSTAHHHHLVCRSCGRTVEVADPPLDRWAARIAAEHGFADVEHELEVFGTCHDCAARS